MEWKLKLDAGGALMLYQYSPTIIRMRLGAESRHVDTPITVEELMLLAEVIGKFTELGGKN